MRQLETAIIEEGFVISECFFDDYIIEKAEESLNEHGAFDFSKNDENTINLLKCSRPVFDLAANVQLNKLISKISKREMFPVKAFVLDKTVQNNWEIPWHQDLKIAVQKKLTISGYNNWSKEAGIIHVEPPVEIMSQFLTLRIHFDSCYEENGAINIIPGSHKRGRINEDEILIVVNRGPKQLCKVDKYGVMFMRPLILHNSPLSFSLMPRRILQIEYGFELNNGLQWHDL
jgi:ectoine hydroxylase-related dioxygenase (phytanoyl-CoA dioxygenase family)